MVTNNRCINPFAVNFYLVYILLPVAAKCSPAGDRIAIIMFAFTANECAGCRNRTSAWDHLHGKSTSFNLA